MMMFYRCHIDLDLPVQLPIAVQNDLSQSLIVGEEPVYSDKTGQLLALDSSLVAKQLSGSLIKTVLCRSPRRSERGTVSRTVRVTFMVITCHE